VRKLLSAVWSVATHRKHLPQGHVVPANSGALTNKS